MRTFFASLVLAAVLAGSSSAASTLRESGSTLMYPLLTTWAQAYGVQAGATHVETESTGSGRGVADVLAGTADLGVTDAYAIDTNGAVVSVVQIPLAISAVQVNYNLPEVAGTHLRFTGEVLAAIFAGTIRFWDDPAIAALNPNLPHVLPHREIETYHRSDSSGTTFVFSQFLTESSASWKSGPGFGNRVHWPNGPWSHAVVGNAGVFHACEVMRYSLGYMGVSYRSRADAANLGYASIRNTTGAFVLPTPMSIRAAAYAMLPSTPNGAQVSLINAPGEAAYPIANYEYAVVREQQPDATTAESLKKFLAWAVDANGGNADQFLIGVNFSSLPANVRDMALLQIQRIR